MKISRTDVRKGKDYLLNEHWGRIDRCWMNFSIRSMSAENRDDAKLIILRSTTKNSKRLVIYLLYRKKKDDQLLITEVFRLWRSSDKFRISEFQVFGKNRISVSLKISTGQGKYTWSQIVKEEMKNEKK